jgi:hypothetical protein
MRGSRIDKFLEDLATKLNFGDEAAFALEVRFPEM